MKQMNTLNKQRMLFMLQELHAENLRSVRNLDLIFQSFYYGFMITYIPCKNYASKIIFL